MNARTALVPVLAVTLLAGCSSAGSLSSSPVPSGEPSQVYGAAGSDARQMCVKVLGAKSVLSSGPLTTVGELRAMKLGSRGGQPAKGAFPSLPDSVPASCCWTAGTGFVFSFGVTADGQKQLLTSIGGPSWTPSGPPVAP